MIEKKIRYDINIEKPSKTKPVKQGGVLNYLGKQKTVNAPRHWRSSPKHPIAHLSYITKDEEKILIDLNLYGSLKGKPNRGPFGLPSLQGSGGGAGGGGDGGGDGGGQGDSGPGGSDDGSGHGGPGPGDSGPGGSDDGSGHGGPGPGSGSGQGPGAEGGFGIGPGDDGMGMGMGPGGSETGFGIGPGDEDAAAQSVTADNVSMQAQAEQEDAATAAAAQAAQSETGITNTLTGLAQKAIDAYMTYSPTVNAMKGLASLVEAVANPRGVTAPDDYSQVTESVQFGPPPEATESGGSGITTIPTYAPLYNPTTGDNTVDSLIAIYRKQLGY